LAFLRPHVLSASLCSVLRLRLRTFCNVKRLPFREPLLRTLPHPHPYSQSHSHAMRLRLMADAVHCETVTYNRLQLLPLAPTQAYIWHLRFFLNTFSSSSSSDSNFLADARRPSCSLYGYVHFSPRTMGSILSRISGSTSSCFAVV